MIKLHEIPITVRIHLTHSQYNESGWPLCEVSWNNNTVKRFEANVDKIEFTIVQNTELDKSILQFHHYGINHHRDDKWVEIQKIYINNIDLRHILWDGVQHAFIPPWDDLDPIMPGNLYLGYNGNITWTFDNPILLDIQKRLGRTVKTIHGQETTAEVLEKTKKYFWNHV